MALTVSVKPASNRACFSKSSLSASSAPALGPFLWNMTSSDQNSSLSDFYFGGCSSPRNQPTASDFIGSSDGTAICSTRSHSEQSNLLSSNPVGPARCVQVSCARGILGSGVAELRTLGLRLGN